MTCSIPDCPNIAERSGKCATHARLERKAEEESLKPPKTKKPIAKTSDKMAEALKVYAKRRKLFLEAYPMCFVYPHLPAVEIHHMKGRATIELLLDEQYWLHVSREAHQKIELNPEWAKEQGYSLSRLSKQTP